MAATAKEKAILQQSFKVGSAARALDRELGSDPWRPSEIIEKLEQLERATGLLREKLMENEALERAEEEAADEAAWDARFAASGDMLERLAADADEEHRKGLTIPLDSFLEEEA